MDVIAILRAAVSRALLGFIVILSLLATPAYPAEYQDSQIFISGFNAYQSKNYQGAIDKMSQVLEKYPDSPLRDMSIFWLARAHFKAGHRKEAAQYMANFGFVWFSVMLPPPQPILVDGLVPDFDRVSSSKVPRPLLALQIC